MKNFIIKYIWQFPQMLIAFIWFLIKREDITDRIQGKDYILYIGNNRGGVTLGNRIFLSNHYQGEYLQLIIAHESGHVIQSKYLGPLYIFIIGIPSLLWAWLHRQIAPKKSYYWFYTESIANKLGGVGINKEGILTWKHLIE